MKTMKKMLLQMEMMRIKRNPTSSSSGTAIATLDGVSLETIAEEIKNSAKGRRRNK